MKLRMQPDYFDGEVLGHHPNGFTLVKEPAYSTSIDAPPEMPDLGGVSGGPLLSLQTGKVHGVLSPVGRGTLSAVTSVAFSTGKSRSTIRRYCCAMQQPSLLVSFTSSRASLRVRICFARGW